ncbi:MAG: class I SAM-dependent methyltransferase, partial [Eubacteriales bacterium]|nr:class I SAM-dependent methyltransferase [Eubacteriales bacterium]
DNVLEVAAGTCATGRAIAPYVNSVTCVDITSAMLEAGKRECEKSGISNIDFVEGPAEDLAFEDGAFDAVITRLSFHHYAHTAKPFSEIDRVLKPGDRLVIIDMEAAEDSLRPIEDEIETLRDPSHVKNRSRAEFEMLYGYGYDLIKAESTPIPVNLTAWMNLTKTCEATQNKIRGLMLAKMRNNGNKTGFNPYQKDGEILFDQRWLFLMGVKNKG